MSKTVILMRHAKSCWNSGCVEDFDRPLNTRGKKNAEMIARTLSSIGYSPELVMCSTAARCRETLDHMTPYFSEQIKTILADRDTANMALLRGFSKIPDYPNISDKYKMKCAAIAAYPMYKGLAKLIGMSILDSGNSFESEIETLKTNYDKFDFFFLHYKPADAAGEDGDFKQKVKSLEYLNGVLNQVLSLKPDTFILAGDHSTPSVMASHSWHPVPFLINSKLTYGSRIQEFTENQCRNGSIGNINATQLMLLALAHSDRLNKFGP